MRIPSIRLLAGGIILYTLIFSGISLWKYGALRYNARDLAIYNQVIFQLQDASNKLQETNLIDRFNSSIQGHNYLGDHVEPVLLLLVPFYKLFPDPRTLLALQTLALALAAWPLYLIAQELTDKRLDAQTNVRANGRSPLPLLAGLLWLLHPAVQNANLFEFHSLAFAPLFLFSLFYFFLKITSYGRMAIRSRASTGRPSLRDPYIFFLIFLLLSLSVREDVALIIFVLGLLMLWKGLKERALIPAAALTLILSVGWFVAAQRIIAHFSPSQGYQYRIYYQWLTQFDSFSESVQGILSHLFTLQNLEMLLGLLLPLLFLLLRKPLWLLLTLPPLAAIILSQAGGSSIIWQMHYSLLLLPGIFIGLIYAFIAFIRIPHPRNQENNHPSILRSWYLRIVNYFKFFLSDAYVLALALLVATVASAVSFGPLIPAVKAMKAGNQAAANAGELINSAPTSSSVAATDRFLAPLSSRRDLTLLPLRMLGVQQYGVGAYEVTPFPDYVLLDEEDVWADLVQARSTAWMQPTAPSMRTWFRRWLENGGYRIEAQQGAAVLLTRGAEEIKIPPFAFEEGKLDGVNGWLGLDRLGSIRLVTDITDH